MHSKRKFPGWMGPIVGAIAGGGMAIAAIGRARADDVKDAALTYWVVFVGSGIAAGFIIWWMDARKNKEQ